MRFAKSKKIYKKYFKICNSGIYSGNLSTGWFRRIRYFCIQQNINQI